MKCKCIFFFYLQARCHPSDKRDKELCPNGLIASTDKEIGTVVRAGDWGLEGPHEGVKVFTHQEKGGSMNMWQTLPRGRPAFTWPLLQDLMVRRAILLVTFTWREAQHGSVRWASIRRQLYTPSVLGNIFSLISTNMT